MAQMRLRFFLDGISELEKASIASECLRGVHEALGLQRFGSDRITLYDCMESDSTGHKKGIQINPSNHQRSSSCN